MLKRNLVANYLGQGWVALMGFVFVPVYIRYLGIEAYGVIGLFAMLQAWLALLDAGLNIPLRRELAGSTGRAGDPMDIRDLLRSIEWVALGIGIVVAGGIHLSAGWLATNWLQAENLPASEVALAFSCMGLVAALRMIEGVYRSTLLGLQRQVEFNVANSTMATVRALGAVAVLAWCSPTLQAFFLWQGASSLATLALLWQLSAAALPRASRSPVFSLRQLREIGTFAASTMGVTFLGLLLTQTDKILLSRLLPLADYGRYTLAALIAGALYVLSAPVTQALFPRLSQLQAAGDAAGFAHTFHKGAQLASTVIGSAASVLIMFSEPILRLWTGEPDLAKPVAPLLALLVGGTLLGTAIGMPYQAQLAHGLGGLAIRVNVVAVLLIIPALIFVTPKFGAIGAATVWLVLNAGYVMLMPHFMYRRILVGHKTRWYIHDLLLPLGAAIGTSLLVRWATPTSAPAILEFTAIVVSFVASFCAAGIVCPDLRHQALALLPRKPSARLP